MKVVTTVNPKALIGGVINTDNELLSIDDMQQFLQECAECIGEQFSLHPAKGKAFSFYLKDGKQQFTEEESTKLDEMMYQCSVLCEELHDDLEQLIKDAIQETKGVMTESEVKNALLGIIGEAIDIDEVVSIEENAGSNWITMSDGKTYFIMVQECEQEEEGE